MAGPDGLLDPNGHQRPASHATALRLLGGLLPLVGAGLLLQSTWLLLWPLGSRLTHGAEFTESYLASRPAIAGLLRLVETGAQAVVPGLAAGATEVMLLDRAALTFVIAGIAYLSAVVLVDRGLPSMKGVLPVVLGFVLLFQATLLLMPGLFTTDIFAYLMYGHLGGVYGLNPYVHPPSALPDHPLLPWINPMWHDQPSVYGPLWTAMSVALAPLIAPLNLADQVLVYKLLMNAVHLVNLALVWWLLGRFALQGGSERARLTAFTLFAWNPLLLFEIAGNAHNDGLMVTLLLLALVPLAFHARGGIADREGGAGLLDRSLRSATFVFPRLGAANAAWLAGLVVVGLSALVKYTTGLVGLFYAAAWASRLSGWRPRLAWIGGSGLLVLSIGLVLAWPWLQIPQALQPLLEAAGGSRRLNSVPDLLAVAIADHALDPLRLDTDAARGAARAWMDAGIRLLFVGYLVWELRRVWSASTAGWGAAVQAVVTASTRGLLVLIVLVFTWVLPWYFAWPLAPAVLLGWRSTLARVAVAYSLVCLPVFYLNKHWGAESAAPLLLLFAGLPLLLPLAGWAGARGQLRSVAVAALVVSTFVPGHWVANRPAPFCQPGDGPQFVMGFAELEARLGEIMGEPLECEHVVSAKGDTRQQTTVGLASYRKATNTPVFTDGWRYWALTEKGLVSWTGGGMHPPPWAEPWTPPAGTGG